MERILFMTRYPTYLVENTRFDMGLAEAPTVLVKYKIGEGGFGEVWRASSLTQHKNYALKQINVPRLIEQGRIARADKATLIERIKREASVNVPSEYVVRCYGYRELHDHFFMLADFVAGDKLSDWIADHLEMPWPARKALFLQILAGVRDLHQAGIIHRDLKPANILITLETQLPKIIDFGLAKLDDSNLTMSGDFSGSKFYKDPGLVGAWEGIKAGDRASDVYALGIMLYEMVMGQNPWQANHLPYEELFNQIAGNDNVLDLDQQFQLAAPPDEIRAVQDAIRLSTRFDRAARLQSVAELLTRLGGRPNDTAVKFARPDVIASAVPRSNLPPLAEDGFVAGAPRDDKSAVAPPRAAAPPRRRSAWPTWLFLFAFGGSLLYLFRADLPWPPLRLPFLASAPTPTPLPTPEPTPPPARITLRSKPLMVAEEDAAQVFQLNAQMLPREYGQPDLQDQGDIALDRVTGLLWQKVASATGVTHGEAQEYCERLALGNDTAWRLPTVAELLSLMTAQPNADGVSMPPMFHNLDQWVWSADQASHDWAWHVNFATGGVSTALLGTYPGVRCVRSAVAAPFAPTPLPFRRR